MDQLIAERNNLADAADRADQGGYPGSKAYRAYSAALLAMAEFDKAHPEVIKEIKSRHAASIGMSDFALAGS